MTPEKVIYQINQFAKYDVDNGQDEKRECEQEDRHREK
jgi:hypothetical protein